MVRASATDVDTRASAAVVRASVTVEQARHAATAMLEASAAATERATIAANEARATVTATTAALRVSATVVERATAAAAEVRASVASAACTTYNCGSCAISKCSKQRLGASSNHSSNPVPPIAAMSSLGAKIGLGPLIVEVTLTLCHLQCCVHELVKM
jgi:hypothetical protein